MLIIFMLFRIRDDCKNFILRIIMILSDYINQQRILSCRHYIFLYYSSRVLEKEFYSSWVSTIYQPNVLSDIPRLAALTKGTTAWYNYAKILIFYLKAIDIFILCINI